MVSRAAAEGWTLSVPFTTVDEVQRHLVATVFGNRANAKKAAGRALGTIQELIVYFLLEAHGLADRLLLEFRLPEYGYPTLRHRADFTMHPRRARFQAPIVNRGQNGVVLVPSELEELLGISYQLTRPAVLTEPSPYGSGRIFNCNPLMIRNVENWISDLYPMARLLVPGEDGEVNILVREPVAYVESKRVGLEEGTATGPQTIEKAKQGAYVALRSSRLQKVVVDGHPHGIFIHDDTTVEHGAYQTLFEKLVSTGDPSLLKGVVLSCTFVGNHVNWFPSGVAKKDIAVLTNSFDWVVWVKDDSLANFLDRFIVPDGVVREAFRSNYLDRTSGKSYFTKARLPEEAYRHIHSYFRSEIGAIEQSWFEVLEPRGRTLTEFFDQVHALLAILE